MPLNDLAVRSGPLRGVGTQAARSSATQSRTLSARKFGSQGVELGSSWVAVGKLLPNRGFESGALCPRQSAGILLRTSSSAEGKGLRMHSAGSSNRRYK